MSPEQVKQQVREFYDQVGWQKVAGDQYQNARYEDLRPVSAEYIHRCHLRVRRHLKARGRFLLDAGSGPVQYPEYLTYSQDYAYRVCADISMVALKEARGRLGQRGLYVVADVANLPFAPSVFDGVVSLHTLHHLPLEDQIRAYHDVYRVLAPASSAVIVNGWTDSPLMRRWTGMVDAVEALGRAIARLRGRAPSSRENGKGAGISTQKAAPTGTFVRKLNAAWLREQLGGKMEFEILVWRSVSVRWLRAMIHALTGGRLWLRLLYRLEERSPQWYGENGQYPMIVIKKGAVSKAVFE
jgi:SAM-dependent methyltransferase